YLSFFAASTASVSPLFPYTPLFRSNRERKAPAALRLDGQPVVIGVAGGGIAHRCFHHLLRIRGGAMARIHVHVPSFRILLEQVRSEEHTSELQSREKFVCRLLLEKK